MCVFSVNFNCVDPYVPSFNGDNYSFKVYIVNSVHNSLVSLDHLIRCDSRLYNDAREGSFVSLARMCKRYSPPFSQEPRLELNLLMLILLIVGAS